MCLVCLSEAGSVSFSEINESSAAGLLWTSMVKFFPPKDQIIKEIKLVIAEIISQVTEGLNRGCQGSISSFGRNYVCYSLCIFIVYQRSKIKLGILAEPGPGGCQGWRRNGRS